MIFSEFRFFFFFLLVFAVTWTLTRNRSRKRWLLVASYAFYAAWDVRFLSLILVSTLVDYAVGVGLSRTDDQRSRRLLLAASVVVNLSILATFKYADFFVDSAETFLGWLGFALSWPTLNLVLPVGISFFTFQTMSYTIDVYRRKIEPTSDLADLALFVAFFPQLVAGPIVRARQFLPQLSAAPRWATVNVRACLVLILVGYVQKAVVADNIAPIVDRLYAEPDAFGFTGAWLGAFAFVVQIYGDFAGYSNMAIGLGGLLGYTLPKNFDFPYFARNLNDLWRRWHITLSTWMRDYVLFPLRKPGQTRLRLYANLLMVMALLGLWHQASWKFVLFGVIHGIALIGYLAWRRRRRGRARTGGLAVAASVVATMLFWTFTAPLFRAADSGDAWRVMRALAGFPGGDRSLAAFGGQVTESLIALVLIMLWLTHWAAYRGWFNIWQRCPVWLFAAGFGVATQLALATAAVGTQPFIYFQF